MSKKITRFEEGFVLIQDDTQDDIPLTCPVCEYFISTDQDVFYYTQHKLNALSPGQKVLGKSGKMVGDLIQK